jgi:hypothetical protein
MKHFLRLDRALLLILTFVVVFFLATDDAEGDDGDAALKPLAVSLLDAQIHASLPDDHPVMVRARDAAKDVTRAVVRLVAAKQLPLERAAQWRANAYLWSFYESSFYANPPGSNDKGAAAGVMQLHVAALPPEVKDAVRAVLPNVPLTATSLRASREYGYLVGLTLLLYLERTCGSRLGALAAYSTTGACPTSGIPSIVVSRCAMIPGGC